MKLDLKIQAIKDGQMENGNFFAYKGETYLATIENWPEEEGGDFYYIEDALHERGDKNLHGMDKEFFDEYFKIIKNEKKTL
jgi:hypothetical protein